MIFQQGPRAEKDWRTAEQISTGRSAHDHLDDRFDQRTDRRSRTASIHSLHSSGRNGGKVVGGRPSIGRRMLRSFTRFLVTLLIGVGGTLAWQSYGDAARQMAVTQVPTLAWLLAPS